MTTISEFTQLIQSFFTTKFASTGVTIAYDNIPLDRTEEEFARLNISNADSNLRTIGAPGNREIMTSFIVTVQVFTKPGSGRARSDELIQKVQEIFMSGELKIWIIPFGISTVGLTDPAYYQANISFAANNFQVM